MQDFPPPKPFRETPGPADGPVLTGLNIFVAEDSLLIALDLCEVLAEAGALVVGPARSLAEAESLVRDAGQLDVALLDLHLGDDTSAPIAFALQARGVPVILTTGSQGEDLPDALRGIMVRQKPVPAAEIIRAICQVLETGVGDKKSSAS